MIATTFWISWLALRRDRTALLFTLLLPPLLFLAFAAMFANAPGHDIKLKLVVADLARTPLTRRLTTALEQARALRVVELDPGTAADVADVVRRGTSDAGLIINADLVARGPTPPLVVVQAPDRPLAASMALGQVQRAMSEALPDVFLTRILNDLQATEAIDADDRAFLDKAFAAHSANRAGEHYTFSKLGSIEPLSSASSGRNGGVLQYAAAVSAIFLLFGAMQGAYVLIDERQNGLADRVRLASGGMPRAIVGRFLFLVVQGAAQVALIYLTAFVVYGASFQATLLPLWLGAGSAAAAACAGLALLACSLSKTRKQAELWTTFAVLLLSALGGSMVPRYLMPTWLQSTSWWTPNAWIMQALQDAIRPGHDPADLTRSLAVLGGIAVCSCAASMLIA